MREPNQELRSAPPHTGSPGPFGPGTPEESEKSPERVPRGRAPKVPKECAPESQKSPKRVRKSGFRLFSDSFETPGRTLSTLLGPCPGVLFPDSYSDSSGVPGPKGPGDPVWGGADLQTKKARVSKTFHRRISCSEHSQRDTGLEASEWFGIHEAPHHKTLLTCVQKV